MLMFRNKFSVCGNVNWVNEWSVFEGKFCNTTIWAFRKFVFDKTCNPTAVITLLYSAQHWKLYILQTAQSSVIYSKIFVNRSEVDDFGWI